MSALTANADALMAVLQPELERLCKNAPQFGVLTLRADIHDGDVGRVSLGIETARKIAPRTAREGGQQ
ncbi:MAG: hypothetical protein SAMD01599839_05770 [Rectinema sp.]